MVHNLVAGLLTTSLVLSLAIFLYATFYHAYMPIEVAGARLDVGQLVQVHEEDLELQFRPCDTKPALCRWARSALLTSSLHCYPNTNILFPQLS